MARVRGLGFVSPAERQAADLFFADLLGTTPVASGRTVRSQPRAAQRAEQWGERLGGTTPLPLEHFVQWLVNSTSSDGPRRRAPLGPAWVRQRLAEPWARSVLEPAAEEMRQLDAARTNRHGTDFRADTGSVQVINRASGLLLDRLERIDTAATTGARCPRTFATTIELADRKDHWRAQIDALARTSQSVLLDWIIGKQSFSANATVRAATSEASDQIECMRRAINAVRSAQSLADPQSRSPVRDFESQLCIWMRKYGFHANPSRLAPPCGSSAGAATFGAMLESSVATVHAAMPSTSHTHFRAGAEWNPVGSGAQATAHRTAWTTHLSSDQREQEILQTSSAPGISRHHWGTDVDYGSVTPSDWLTNAAHRNLYRWLQTHALAFGMVQVFTPDRPGYTASSPRTGYNGYIEERWHWSYYPVAQALLEWASQASSKTAILTRLQSAWGDVRTGSTYATARRELGWTASTNAFHYIEAHWEDYVFNVNRHVTPPVV